MLPVFTHAKTPRFELRSLVMSDARELLSLIAGSRAELGQYMSWPRELYDLEQARHFVKLCRDGWVAERTVRLGVFELTTGELVGNVELDNIDLRRSQSELGYWVRTDRARRGYATEAAEAMVRYAFSSLRMHKVRADVAVGNHASARVLTKLGFKLEGTLREDRKVGQVFVDHWRFGLLAREFR